MADETDRHNVRDSDEFEALRNLYASYRFEIDNLWKRSSILSVFVGLFFVGYGQLALRMLDNLGNEEKLADSAICNALICGIAFVAIVFSVIWISLFRNLDNDGKGLERMAGSVSAQN